ncbi:MAG: flagellar hook-basal body protein [Planctomycetes bacterium]|nr:flagellar hook-basal body protein [Planctomycetota bacterium]
MIYGFYTSTVGGLVETTRQEVLANNLANANTPGFKRDYTIFRERATEAQENQLSPFDVNQVLERIGGNLFLDRTPYEPTAGPLESTGLPLDVALDGPGWFAVGDGRGTYYTRNGEFTRNARGEMVNQDGLNVLDETGRPILLGDQQVHIDEHGAIDSPAGPIARLGLYDAADPQDMRKRGDSLHVYEGQGQPRRVLAPVVRQGFLEKSNVEPVTEMVRMIDGMRAYEANMRLVREADRSLQRVLNELPRV